MRFKLWPALSAALLLGACVAPPVALTPQLQQSLDSVQAVAFIPQTNLDVDVTPGNPGATGLLGALIVAAVDESRRTKAQQASFGLVEALREFGFRERMPRQLDAEFARLATPRLAGPVILETTDSESLRRILYDNSRASAVLFTSVTYKLVDAKLVVSARSVMLPKARTLMQFRPTPNNTNPLDEGNAIYRKTFTYRSETVDRERIELTLAAGMANVAWQLATDMGHIAGSPDTVRTAALPPVGRGAAPMISMAVAQAPAPAAATPAPSRAIAVSGVWSGTYRCGKWLGPGTADNPNGWTVPAEMSVQGGKATLVRGDANYREVSIGDVSPDSTLVLRGQGSMNRTPDRPWRAQVMGSFAVPSHGRFQGSGRLIASDGTPLRDCSVDLVQSSGD